MAINLHDCCCHSSLNKKIVDAETDNQFSVINFDTTVSNTSSNQFSVICNESLVARVDSFSVVWNI